MLDKEWARGLACYAHNAVLVVVTDSRANYAPNVDSIMVTYNRILGSGLLFNVSVLVTQSRIPESH